MCIRDSLYPFRHNDNNMPCITGIIFNSFQDNKILMAAYLYHRVGLATKCVEECDELILWFGEGKYVMKAMALKMLHQPLSPAQQQKYEAYLMRKQGLRVPEHEDKQDKNSAGRKKAEEDDIHVKPMDCLLYTSVPFQCIDDYRTTPEYLKQFL